MPRARRKTAEEVDLPPVESTIQLLDGDGKPLTAKMSTAEFSRRAEVATRTVYGAGCGGGSNQPAGGATLRSLVERIEQLEEGRAALGAEIREAYAEAKAEGLMVKVLRLVVRRRRRGGPEVRDEDEMVRLYEDMLS